MALNETYEKEVEVPFQLVEIPKNVVLTSDTTTYVRVTVRDKGFSLLAYLYGNNHRTPAHRLFGIHHKFHIAPVCGRG